MITRLSFAAPFVYSRAGTSAVAVRSRRLRDRVKRADTDLFRQIGVHVASVVGAGQFRGFFGDDVTLLAIPGHAPLAPGAISNSQRIVVALLAQGLGAEGSDALTRATRVAKSAFARPEERPRAVDHFRSFAMERSLARPRRVLLVDDFVTRGATLVGAASRVAEVFPDAEVAALHWCARSPMATLLRSAIRVSARSSWGRRGCWRRP